MVIQLPSCAIGSGRPTSQGIRGSEVENVFFASEMPSLKWQRIFWEDFQITQIRGFSEDDFSERNDRQPVGRSDRSGKQREWCAFRILFVVAERPTFSLVSVMRLVVCDDVWFKSTVFCAEKNMAIV